MSAAQNGGNYRAVRPNGFSAAPKSTSRLYSWNPLHKFFIPAMKTKNKRREGGRIIKTYDEPKTPYQRLMDCPKISKENKLKLKQRKESLDPVKLSQELDQLLKTFFTMLRTKRWIL